MANHARRSIRLQGYDYAQAGAYFVTLCTHQRLHLFGHIRDGVMSASAIGAIVEAEWMHTAAVRPQVELDAFVIMPNHLHGILVIHANPPVGATRRVALSPNTANTLKAASLGAMMGQFKSVVTKRVRQQGYSDALWQRNYHDHIIRSETEINRLREYIFYNPARWHEDTLFA